MPVHLTAAAMEARADPEQPRTACSACRAPQLRPAFGDAVPAFLRCRECRTLHAANPPTPEEVKRLYEGRAYFVKDDGDDDDFWGYRDDYLADRHLIGAKFDRVLGHLERYVTPGRLLDVGAGPGFLVAAAERRGWAAVGIDVNAWAAAHARDELGLDVRSGSLDDEPFEDGSFDAVTMMDVIEHVADPDDMLAHAARLVRPGGALALLTPDAGSLISRMFGRRWPEVRRPGEHINLFSVQGLASILGRHGFVASGWHWIGKEATISTLLADVSPVLPRWSGRIRESIDRRPLGRHLVELDPRTKFCLYARRLPEGVLAPSHQPARVPRRPEQLAPVGEAILDELESLAQARRLRTWMFDAFAGHVRGSTVLEVGAGIGTFTRLMLDAGAAAVVAVEPDPSCAQVLERSFAGDQRVRVTRDALPEAPSLAGQDGRFDLVVCQNVLEHIGDDGAALQAMARLLRPGGHLSLLVPAGPRLFGALDDAYGHWRRYAAVDLRDLVTSAGFEVLTLRFQNALGIAGWWAKNVWPGARIGSTSLRLYESAVALWRPIEERLEPRMGLSLVCLARTPIDA